MFLKLLLNEGKFFLSEAGGKGQGWRQTPLLVKKGERESVRAGV